MNRRKCICALIIISMLVVLLMGCSTASDNSDTKKTEDILHKKQIGITFDTFVLDRWLKDRDVFVATAEKLGAEVDVQNANGDVEKQKGQIRQFVENQVDVIVVVAVDCYSLGEEVQNARNHGIQVVAYDRMIQGCTPDLYITVDGEKIGRAMGEAVIKNVPSEGTVVMICGPETDTNCQEIAKGFEAVLKDTRIKIGRKSFVKAWTSEYGTQAIEKDLEEFPQIDGVMCGNDGLAGYVIQALSEKQLAGKTVVVGQDADIEACQRVVEGTQTMTVYKPIEELAQKAAEYAIELADKGKIRDVTERMNNDVGEVLYVGLDPVAVTKDNMDEVIIDSGFHLRDEVYLNVKE